MNNELRRRWRADLQPFDGQTLTFASDELTPLPALRHALVAVASWLQQRWPTVSLFKMDDWHEHDGFLTDGKPIFWNDIMSYLASDTDVMGMSHYDWNIRFAVFPATYDFYLRVYVPTDDDNDYRERRGEFDVTGSPEVIGELAQAVETAGGSTSISKAKDYFDSRYGG